MYGLFQFFKYVKNCWHILLSRWFDTVYRFRCHFIMYVAYLLVPQRTQTWRSPFPALFMNYRWDWAKFCCPFRCTVFWKNTTLPLGSILGFLQYRPSPKFDIFGKTRIFQKMTILLKTLVGDYPIVNFNTWFVRYAYTCHFMHFWTYFDTCQCVKMCRKQVFLSTLNVVVIGLPYLLIPHRGRFETF